MKKQMTAFIICAIFCLSLLPCPAAASSFSDISDDTTALAAAALQGLGVVSGTGGGCFEPDSFLTRAELCTMAVNAMGLGDKVSTYSRKTLFSDVPSSAWYNGYINLAYSEGLINGYGNGTFGPNDTVTYGQAAAIMLRMLDYTTAEIGSVWPTDYTAFSDSLGLSDGLFLGAYDGITRGQAAILLYRTLKADINGSDQPRYSTLSGISSTSGAILLDTDASYGGSGGLVMAYSLESGSGSISYYQAKNEQSDTLEGYMGTLLFDSSGSVKGFIPDEGGWDDITAESATPSGFTTSRGMTKRVSSDTVLIYGGTVYPYTTTGYLQINSLPGWSGVIRK